MATSQSSEPLLEPQHTANAPMDSVPAHRQSPLPQPGDTDIQTVIVHTDGAYDADADIGTVGYTLETNTGDTLHEGNGEYSCLGSSMQAEALAAVVAADAARQYDPSFVLLHTDCKLLKRYLTEHTARKNVLEELCEQFRLTLESVEFVRIKETKSENNEDAHDLANDALTAARDGEDEQSPRLPPRI